TCTFSDGTVLTQTISALGAQGTGFSFRASRQLQLDFARVLTNGTIPTLVAVGSGSINNMVYTPAVAALAQNGCGGVGGTALSVNGVGTLGVTGDAVSNGAVSVASGTLRVAGDIYARCQSSITGTASACYPSGGSTPCGYPDVAGATRSGFHLVDPAYPAPSQLGGAQGAPNANVVLLSGIYGSLVRLNSRNCWFLSGGVYDFPAGYSNQGDFVSNELKPPDEPDPSDNTERAASQFWNTNGVNCSGSVQVQRSTGGDGGIQTGNWAFEVTSTRFDTYNGISYMRESAPSMCQTINLNPHFNDVQMTISNVPGATAYNVYAAPPNNGCSGHFGLATTVQVSSPVLNTNTNPCPAFNGNGCSLGHETVDLESALESPFAPNAAAAPGTTGAYPPDPETAPLAAGLPDQNPGRGAGPSGDRANENNCETSGGAYSTCPDSVTPGAVEFYSPVGGCITTGPSGDTYVFSGYQYNWIAAYEPPANSCTNGLGAASNSAYVGLFYAPGATVNVSSAYVFEVAGTAGVMGSKISFTSNLPSIAYSSAYAPVPPASRLSS
ncbi:MAG TPA: hypothetical protein VEU76_00885, partial [Candidatus Udaeobacter sp.]|nr:hypothetical protein [Candidatus Udaeobacter sp.]